MNRVKQKMKRAMSTHVAKMKSTEWLTTLKNETNEGGAKNLTKGKKSCWTTSWYLDILISWSHFFSDFFVFIWVFSQSLQYLDQNDLHWKEQKLKFCCNIGFLYFRIFAIKKEPLVGPYLRMSYFIFYIQHTFYTLHGIKLSLGTFVLYQLCATCNYSSVLHVMYMIHMNVLRLRMHAYTCTCTLHLNI